MPIKLGCIADDFTGATDLANNLVRAGMRVIQVNGVPKGPLHGFADAVVVALKTRTVSPAQAVEQSLTALAWLQTQAAQQIYFKYCSTFDSRYGDDTPGNIGPVTDALMDAMDIDFTIATPAFPDNQRTVFKGHLFVGDVLLSDSGMRHHPLTPMRNANLVQVLQAQTKRRVGLVDYRTVAAGEEAIRAQISRLKLEGFGVAIVDALSNDDLLRLGPALSDMALITAGSGVAIGLPGNFGLRPSQEASRLTAPQGYQAILAGSCSLATQAQVQTFRASGRPSLALDALALARQRALGEDSIAPLMARAKPHLPSGPILIYSSADAPTIQAVQAQLGTEVAGQLVEHVLAALAKQLVQNGVAQLILAGGETSGACVQALAIEQMHIGPQIAPGVPWCHALSPFATAQGLHVCLKSGNFGGDQFFTEAFSVLE
jgi:3-dehydrotetronate 4-kinase